MHRPLLIVLLLGLAVPAPAQLGPGQVIILTDVAGTSGLIAVDIASGAITSTFGTFPSASFPPLAVAYDTLVDDLIVAVMSGSQSRILRLDLNGTAIASEQLLATLPGTLTALGFDQARDIVASTDGPSGAIWTVPRNGGAPVQTYSAPYVTSMERGGNAVQSPPTGDPNWFAPNPANAIPFTGLAGVRITSTIDFGTSAFRYGFGDDQGTLRVFQTSGGAPSISTWATGGVPPGGIAEIHRSSVTLDALVLGNSGYLGAIAFNWAGAPLNLIATTLPGTPVDFVLAAPPNISRVESFGPYCGPISGFAIGLPQIGTTSFSFGLSGAPGGVPVVLAIGLSDQSWGGFPLPMTLPGGCPVLVSVDTAIWTQTTMFGWVTIPLPLPNDPSLVGTIVFGQWGVPSPTGWTTSQGAAAHIGL